MAGAASRKSPRDHTGRQAEVLAAENAEELAARRGSISTLTDVAVAAEDAAEDNDVTFSDAVEVDQPMVRLRVNTDLPELVVGYGNHFSLYRNQWYRVPKNVADVLEEKGYVYH